MRQSAALLSTITLALVSSSVLAVPFPSQDAIARRAETPLVTDLPPDEADPFEDGLFGGNPALAHAPLPARAHRTETKTHHPQATPTQLLRRSHRRGTEAGFGGSHIPPPKSGDVGQRDTEQVAQRRPPVLGATGFVLHEPHARGIEAGFGGSQIPPPKSGGVDQRDEPARLILISRPKTGRVDQRDTPVFTPLPGFSTNPPPSPSSLPGRLAANGTHAEEPASFVGAFVPHPKAIGQRDTQSTPLTGLPPPTQSFTPIIPTNVPFDPSNPTPSPSSPPGELVPNGKDFEGNPTCDDSICNPLGRRDEPAPLILIAVPKTGGVDQRDTPTSDAFVREPEPLILISRPKTGGVDQRNIQNAMADMVKRSIEELD